MQENGKPRGLCGEGRIDLTALLQGPAETCSETRVKHAVEALQAGGLVVLMDDKHRENEGDLVCAAQFASPQNVNFMKLHGRGLICVPLTHERLHELNLPPQVAHNTSNNRTAFTVSVDAAQGTTTGISASDMSVTIQKLADPAALADDFLRPGHVFPLAADPHGVLRRVGQTEGALDLVKLAGLQPAAVVCEICNPDGSMAREHDLHAYCQQHGLPLLHVQDVLRYRMLKERIVQRIDEARLPTEYADFRIVGYQLPSTGEHHVALVLGDLSTPEPVLVRLHSECLTGDVFHSRRCDCGEQLDWALRKIAAEGRGVLLYLRQEGRGIGLINKIRAYQLQDQGMDTVEANLALGLPADMRDYSAGAQMLLDLGCRELRLITNNPAKLVGLEAFGLKIVDRIPVPLDVMLEEDNAAYLQTKVDKMGHMIDMVKSER